MLGVKFVNAHTHRYGADNQVIGLGSCLWGREQLPAGLYSVGIHPWDSSGISAQEALRWLESHSTAAAIGECGFDFVRGRTELTAQQRLFEVQLEYARNQNLAVVTHCVRGYNELLSVLKNFSSLRVAVHGFAGSLQLAEQLVSRGIYLSFGPTLLTNSRLRDMLKLLPRDLLLLETDDTDVDIRTLYGVLVEELEVDMDSIKLLIYNNFIRLLRL